MIRLSSRRCARRWAGCIGPPPPGESWRPWPRMYKKLKEQIHFVGIGGIGMSGIAEVLALQGFPVSGSDLSDSDTVRRLRELGVRIAVGHRAENLVGAKVVV